MKRVYIRANPVSRARASRSEQDPFTLSAGENRRQCAGLDLSEEVPNGSSGESRVQPLDQLWQHLCGHRRQKRSQLPQRPGWVAACAGHDVALAAPAAPQQEVEKLRHILHRRAVLLRHVRRQRDGARERARQQQWHPEIPQTQLHQHPRRVVPPKRVDALYRLVQQELTEEGSLGGEHKLKRLARLGIPGVDGGGRGRGESGEREEGGQEVGALCGREAWECEAWGEKKSGDSLGKERLQSWGRRDVATARSRRLAAGAARADRLLAPPGRERRFAPCTAAASPLAHARGLPEGFQGLQKVD
mmetsp:Transcript_21841/g.53994  ORF Transcript_21841/g.53994 Transcript_21841/m.53994 type:complete len:303 (+) Transcript_21841:49-957(+)